MTIFDYILTVIGILIMAAAVVIVIGFILSDLYTRFRDPDDDDDENNFDV